MSLPPPPGQPATPSVYDRLRERLDARDLIRRLGLDVARELGSEAYCRPLCHESVSGESLQVNLHTGRWNCKACQEAGVYGDLIQLVEYVLAKGAAPAHGSAQGNSSSHHEAVRWLCEQYAIPYDDTRRFVDPALDVVHLFAMKAHEYLLGEAGMLAWIAEKWGFDRATVEAYGIGYMPSPILPELAIEATRPESREAFRSSGIGFYPPDGTFATRFAGRVTFPYLEHGRAVYLIGRATPATPELDDGGRPPKYHKLSVHNEERPYISKRITNDHLYNEPVLASSDRVVVAEGVADAVALSSIGVPVVSPVTISFNKQDLERFVRKVKAANINRVEIVFDNELSGSGNHGAKLVGRKLVERGLSVSILTLPLGPVQRAARDEVLTTLGAELFAELERATPKRRKEIIEEAIPDENRRAWITSQVEASKIDAAEWVAIEGAGAAGRFDQLRREAEDVVGAEILEAAKKVDPDRDIFERLALFAEVINLVAHVDERMLRESYAGLIAQAAGKGVTKAGVMQKVTQARRAVVEPKREEQAPPVPELKAPPTLVLLPPETEHSQPPIPPPPGATEVVVDPRAPAIPPPPGEIPVSEHDRYAPVRQSVMRAVELKLAEEDIGKHVAQTITLSMGFTPFRTPDELYLVRGNERVPVGLDHVTPRFVTLLYLASSLTPKKTSHRAYIASTVYFLERESRSAHDVAWSYVNDDGEVFFPTGDKAGRILKIGPAGVERTRMAEVRVPAVAGDEFRAFDYVEVDGGIDAVLRAFRWTSLSDGDRLVLIYWIACLPILRRIGTVPIVRIEGGSSSGKSRAVDAVSYLVNGRKSSSVPTAAALISRLAREMITIDDNREVRDMSPMFHGTLLQATNLGAREKRRGNTDTGTVIERVCGALLMNGIEPIHDGMSELSSRMLTLRCDRELRVPDSPVADDALAAVILQHRDRFWSEAVRRCAMALAFDRDHGERLGLAIEEVFGETRIGRLSAYLRRMYLAWIAGLPPAAQPAALAELAPTWREAFGSLGQHALDSLVREELAVSAVRYAFAWAEAAAVVVPGGTDRTALDGKFRLSVPDGDACLGPLTAPQLARIIRAAGKELNAPRSVSVELRAGQLEARILDGIGYLREAGIDVDLAVTQGGKRRFTFYRAAPEAGAAPAVPPPPPAAPPPAGGPDTWQAPELF